MKKILKKLLAVALSATMAFGTPVIALATGTTIDVPNLGSSEYDRTDVVVPSSYAVAFNPDELTVYKDSSKTEAVTSQVVSRDYGIINKSNKDKVVTVRLTIEDPNGKISFVDSLDGHTGVDDYAVKLVLKPSDGSLIDEVEVVSGGKSTKPVTKDTPASALGNIQMKQANIDGTILKAGNNYISFKLDKADFPQLSLDQATGTVGVTSYEIIGLNSGSTAGFTFSGEMNKNADWSKLKKGVKITVRYSWKTATGNEEKISGTNMIKNTSPDFDTGTEPGIIEITAAADGKTVGEIAKITTPWQGTDLDITSYAILFEDKTKIRIESRVLNMLNGAGINPATVTIRYYDTEGEEKSTDVEVITG